MKCSISEKEDLPRCFKILLELEAKAKENEKENGGEEDAKLYTG